MKVNYQKIINFMYESGNRLAVRAGDIDDIGISKTDLTEEGLAIERGFDEIISSFDGEHVLFAEEENDFYQRAQNIWVVDPISGTHNFIKGQPHYSIVIAHLINHKTVFAAVYDPSADEMFTAQLGKGAYLNGKSIYVDHKDKEFILRKSSGWKDLGVFNRMEDKMSNYQIENNRCSLAVNYCWVACGRFNGVVAFTKDAFPEFGGGFILSEAGGKFTNLAGESDILPTDRIFVGGNKKSYSKLLNLTRDAVDKKQ